MKTFLYLLAVISACFLTACAKNVNFSGEEVSPVLGVKVPTCEINMIDKPKPTNILFIVDQSGSNLIGNNSSKVGTDPKKTFRFGIINRFLAQHGNKSHLSWNLITFAKDNSKSLVKDSGKPFTNGLAFILQALDLFFKSKDEGNTPYRAALATAQSLIAKNESMAKEQNTTLIAFITDGHPTDYCPGGSSSSNCPGKVLEAEIDRDVNAIIHASKGDVKFSTIYYGPPDLESTSRLERMAEIGNGQYVDLNSGSNIDLNDVIQVPEKTCSN